MGRPCIIADCDNIVSDNSRLDACELCRASINRWKKRSAAEIYHRRQTLNKYGARLEPLADEDVSKVAPSKQAAVLKDDKQLHITRALVRSRKTTYGKPVK